MRWSPSVTVAAVIRRDDRYLMVEERPSSVRVINQPAGHVEFDESPLQAVQREVLEETGRSFTAQSLLGIYQWTVPDTQRTYLRFCFTGTVGELLPDATIDPDILGQHWLTREQVAHGALPPRSPMVLRCIDDAASETGIAPAFIHVLG
ncbi:MAG: NUDIX hydrolase [Gammaproteobacteria bacterium]|nr:NUDIX hydrolase [Gammaproteobacteria bacterium]